MKLSTSICRMGRFGRCIGLALGLAWSGQVVTQAAEIAPVTVRVQNFPTLDDNPVVDTYDPAQGPYGGSNVGPAPTFETGMAMPNLVEPTGLGPAVGEVLYDGHGNSTITGNIHCGKFLVRTHHVIHISGDVTILVEEEFKVENHARIELMPGASLRIFVKKDATVQDQAAVNPDTTNPFAVTIYNLGVKPFMVQNQSTVCAKMFSPDTFLQVQDGSDFYGHFMGQSLFLKNAAGGHFSGPGTFLEPLYD